MGSYVSVYECRSHYNVTINCAHSDFDNETETYRSLGGFEPGGFPGNPDVAGIGIVGVFIGVTCFALAASALHVLWQGLKTCGVKSRRSEAEKLRTPDRSSLSDILESLVLTCSDQQIFTGAAYALTLRYWQGCKISAYHYNIVGNMMLISCATHLMSVTIVRHYWRYPLLALLRVMCVTGVFVVTGLLMVNQNATGADVKFPTEVPAAHATSSLLFLAAACFETADSSPLRGTFENTTASADAFFRDNLQRSTPGNTIHGWNWYILLLLFYLAAVVAEAIRFFRRHKHHDDWRGQPGKLLARIFPPESPLRRAVSFGYLFYLAGGIVISCITVVKSAAYIFQLRGWVARSGWMETDNGVNPENDWSSFGQLVPIFMSGALLFTVAQVVSEKVTQKRKDKHANHEKVARNGTTIFYNNSQQQYYSLLNNNNNAPNSDGKGDTGHHGASQIATPPPISKMAPFPSDTSFTSSSSNTNTPGANSAASTPHLPGLGLQNTSSPFLGGGGRRGNSSSSIVLSPPPATPPRPLSSRFSSSGGSSSGYFGTAAGAVSPPTPTPAPPPSSRLSRPPSGGTYAPLAQHEQQQQQ